MNKKFTFKDSAGHEWDTSLTMETVFRLRTCSIDTTIFPVPINLTNPSKEFLELIVMDGGALFALLYQILLPQIVKVYGPLNDETELKFLQGVDGETIEKAREAFTSALSFFCPRVKTFFTQHSKMMGQGLAMVEKKVKETQPEFLKLLEQEADRTVNQLMTELKGLRGNSPVN